MNFNTSLIFSTSASASTVGALLSALHQQPTFLSLSSYATTCLQAFIGFIFLYKETPNAYCKAGLFI